MLIRPGSLLSATPPPTGGAAYATWTLGTGLSTADNGLVKTGDSYKAAATVETLTGDGAMLWDPISDFRLVYIELISVAVDENIEGRYPNPRTGFSPFSSAASGGNYQLWYGDTVKASNLGIGSVATTRCQIRVNAGAVEFVIGESVAYTWGESPHAEMQGRVMIYYDGVSVPNIELTGAWS